MNNNEYYILPANKINMVTHQDVIGDINDVRWLNNDFFVCKTKEGITQSKGLTPYDSFNQDEIIVEIAKYITPEIL